MGLRLGDRDGKLRNLMGTIEGQVNAAKCTEVFEENLLQRAHNFRLGQRFTLQHYSDPEFTAKTALE